MKRRFGPAPRPATDRGGAGSPAGNDGARRARTSGRAQPLRSFLPAVVAALVACVLLTVLGAKLRSDGVAGRQALEGRFTTRSEMAADFVEAYVDDVFARAEVTAEARLAQPAPGYGDLSAAAEELGFSTALLLDGEGRVVQSLPARSELVGRRVTDDYAHLAAAVGGTPSVSGVVPSAIDGRPIVGFATPFDTPHGRRVISGGFPLAATPLGTFLRTTTPLAGESSSIVDAEGDVVTSSDEQRQVSGSRLDGALADAMARGSSGSFGPDADRTWFSSVPIEKTPWRLVRSAPEATIYAPVADSRSVAQIVFWLFAAVSAVVVALLTTVLRSRHRIESGRRFLADVLDAIPEPTVVLSGQGNIEHVNAAWWASIERSGGDPSAVGPGADYLAVTAADPSAHEVLAAIRSVLAGDRHQASVVYSMDAPDGTTTWWELTVVRAVDGRGGAVLFHADVTERHTATVRLQSESARAALLADVATAFSTAELDVDHVAELVNEQLCARVGDVSALFLIDESARAFTIAGTSGRDPELAAQATAMLASRPIQVDDDNPVAHAWRNGAPVDQSVEDLPAFMDVMPEDYHEFLDRFPVRQIHAAPVLLGGNPIGVLVLARQQSIPYTADERRLIADIAERAAFALANAWLYEAKDRAEAALRVSEAELLEANGELERFALQASHDLRAPLRRIATFSTFLLEDHYDALDEQGRNYLDEIKQNCTNLGAFVTELLSFAQLVNQPVAQHQVDLGQVAVLAQRALHPVLAERGADVRVSPLPAVLGDFTLLQRLLENLLQNAVTYQPAGRRPVVEIFAEADPEHGDAVVLVVRDNGTGIAEADAESVFRPFKRLVSETVHPGTGLGLSLCQRIAQRHGGRIWLESTLGEGTTFRVRLPAPVERTVPAADNHLVAG